MERSDLEQYATEGNLAAEWLAAMAAFGDLDGQAVVDVGVQETVSSDWAR